MAESSSNKARNAALSALALAASAVLGHVGPKVVSPAQAQQEPVGLATAAQMAQLERKVDRFIERVEAVEREQNFERGIRAAKGIAR